jgi:hypothetical protein
LSTNKKSCACFREQLEACKRSVVEKYKNLVFGFHTTEAYSLMHNHDTNVPSYAALYAGQNPDIVPVKDIRKPYILHTITLLNDVIDDPQILRYIHTLTVLSPGDPNPVEADSPILDMSTGAWELRVPSNEAKITKVFTAKEANAFFRARGAVPDLFNTSLKSIAYTRMRYHLCFILLLKVLPRLQKIDMRGQIHC